MGIVSIVQDIANLGAAGIMGAMWLWERKASRTRESQLDQAHERIMRDEERLERLTAVVRENTGAIARFTELQRQSQDVLTRLIEEMHHGKSK